jgi:S-adenosylmethionine:tRNA ribosyltransferase-isomerase
MKLHDFQYELPESLIAQQPAEKRTGSRLMVLDREKRTIEHRQFEDLAEYLKRGDCIVLNNTKVIPARLLGNRPGSIARVEFLLLEKKSPTAWEVLVSPGRKARPGDRVVFGDGILTASVVGVLEGGTRLVEFEFEGDDFEDLLKRCGQIPLPPYIKSVDVDMERYQTVYSKYEGSVAAPTAGLHFTPSYLETIRDIGVKTAFVTLHVGVGTFKPVKSETIEEHKMHSERYFIDGAAADAINSTREVSQRAGRVIAVGTTSMRTIESVSDERGFVTPCNGRTDIFIYPGYKFKCADALLTNFHLPGSTLIMLVCAFAGYEFTMKAYREAVEMKYRFFSFGDAMLIL